MVRGLVPKLSHVSRPLFRAGVDLGGTNLRAGIIDLAGGAVLAEEAEPTRAEQGPDAVIARIARLVGRVTATAGLPPEGLAAIGVGIPGLYDPATGVVRFLPNLPTTWRGVHLAAELQRLTGSPVTLINDARAFVLAEATFGAGRGAQTVVGMTIGTGIGGGVVIDGRLRLGLDGTAGEVGHQIIDYNGPLCGCGNRGCLEAFASAATIAAHGMKAVRHGWTTSLRELAGGDLNAITPELIAVAAEAGDAVAGRILDEAGFYLGIGVANLVTLFSPDAVVIGGGVAGAGERLLTAIRETVQQRARVTPLERVRIVPAGLGGRAGLIGAAVWAGQDGAAAVEITKGALAV